MQSQLQGCKSRRRGRLEGRERGPGWAKGAREMLLALYMAAVNWEAWPLGPSSREAPCVWQDA